MSILFSRECEYALQAVTLLAGKKKGEMTSIPELTRTLKIPKHFLGKILQRLAGKGLLISSKGPRGGFALNSSAGVITLFHIVDAIDGVSFANGCVFGFPECSGKNPCAVHDDWGAIRESIYQMLVKRSISAVATDVKKSLRG